MLRHANLMIQRGFPIERVATFEKTDVPTLRRDIAMLNLADTIHEARIAQKEKERGL